MNNTRQSIIASAAEILIIALWMAAVPFIVRIDFAATGQGPAEWSLTELLQEALLLLSALVFWRAAWRRPRSRACLVLMAGFFTTMLIREADVFLDKISKGFWVYPAVIVAVGAIAYAVRNRATLFTPLAQYISERFFTFIMIGLLIVIVFSRLFGSSLLWEMVMGELYDPDYKTVVQEGIELMGYGLIFYGSLLFLVRKHPRAAHESSP